MIALPKDVDIAVDALRHTGYFTNFIRSLNNWREDLKEENMLMGLDDTTRSINCAQGEVLKNIIDSALEKGITL